MRPISESVSRGKQELVSMVNPEPAIAAPSDQVSATAKPEVASNPCPSPVVETAQKRASEEMTGMSFLEHLEELRRRIIYSALYVVAGFGICWWFHEQIFAIMQKPIMAALAIITLTRSWFT